MAGIITKREANEYLLNDYNGANIMHPQVILRNVRQIDGNVLDDDLMQVEVSPYGIPDDDLGNFSWATVSLLSFQKQYRRMLEDPTERIHLEALARSGCRIFIENQCSSSRGNSKSGNYGGMSTIISGKPAVVLVAGSFDNTTLLHEAVHNSDLKLSPDLYFNKKHFSALNIYHAAIMMIDAQKISSFDGYDSVKACRTINRAYQEGQLYTEGLAWISEIPMETLAKEKNHIGKHLKSLHALYTEAVMKQQSAVIDCFQYWRPSQHIADLLKEYDKNKQKIGKNRAKILKQQKHFWDELLRFRKEINKLKTHGLAEKTLSYDILHFCRLHGVNSLVPAYMAQQKVDDLYQQAGVDHKAHAANLKALFAEIKPNDLNHSSLFAEKFLACYAYFRKIDKDQMPQTYAESLYELPFDTKDKSCIAVRKKLYDNMKARVNIIELQANEDCSNHHCTLAYLYGAEPASVYVGDAYVKLEMDGKGTLEQKRAFVAKLIDTAQDLKSISNNSAGRLKSEAVIGLSELLREYLLPANIHKLLKGENLRNFDTSAKVVKDLQWVKTSENEDGIPPEKYHWFDAGILDEYMSRPASTFDPQSPDFIPNNYLSQSRNKTAHVRALYELLAARHKYKETTNSKTFPRELRLRMLQPNSDYYRQMRNMSVNKTTGGNFVDKNPYIK